MTPRDPRRPVRSLASILAIVGLLAGMILPGTSLAADPTASAPAASPSPSASSGSQRAGLAEPRTHLQRRSVGCSQPGWQHHAGGQQRSSEGSQVGTTTPAPTATGRVTARPAVPEIFNPANPLVAKPALTGVLPAGFQEQIVINGLSQPTNVDLPRTARSSWPRRTA